MEFQTLILNRSHRTLIEQSLSFWQKEMTVERSVEHESDFFHLLDEYFDETSKPFLVGSFHNDILISIIGAYPWPTKPYVTLSDLKTFNHPKTLRLSSVVCCMKYLLDILKEKNFEAIYSVTSEKQYRKFDSYWKRYLPEYYSLPRTIEARIPANTRPEQNYLWTMMGKHVWPVDLVAFKRRLR